MGCPDWPKCFGAYVPPTSVEQLPQNYKAFYADYRDRKNHRFASFLTRIGLKETGEAILNDPAVRHEADFNPLKTWIEYINRLLGAVIGLLLTVVFIWSFRMPRRITWLCGLAWLLVLVTGWFGSIVVSSNLTPWTVTVHLGLALAITGLLTVAHHYASEASDYVPPSLPAYALFILLAQMFFGTRVRGVVDRLAAGTTERESWIESIGREFILHRTFSWLVLISVVAVAWMLWKRSYSRILTIGLVGLVLGLIFSGAMMAYFGIPWMIQPVHLVLSSLLFSLLLKLSLNPYKSVS